ncbi:hypothetical protein LCGC14_2249180 [marine sediment metagenome]|uniref:DUF7352 domain-containing protein n=1 Tax=marine sediment metagenome TaxID=412755 RepID=A0A0F9FFN1_9ZZZZ
MVEKVIWKYNIPVEGYYSIEMPFGAEILSFQLQYGLPTIWVLVEPTSEKVERRFRLVGTGHYIEESGLKYIGTIKMLNDKLVYHLFEY